MRSLARALTGWRATTTFLLTGLFFLGLQTVFVRRVPLSFTFLQTLLTALRFFVVFLMATSGAHSHIWTHA